MSFSVLVVCLANVCRSPFGERLLTHRLAERGAGQAYVVHSAGVRALEGREMSPQSAVELVARGADADDFAATQLGRDHREADLVLVATRELRSKVLERLPGLMRRAFTIRELAALIDGLAAEDPQSLADASTPGQLVSLCAERRSRVAPAEDADVLDPIGRSDEVYAEMATVVDAAMSTVADQLARVQQVGRHRAQASA